MQAQERLDSYKYPVLTLPNEIISEIFFHFLPAYPLFPPLTGILSPTLLTQICREWREIALAIPTLWSAIPISCSDSPQDFERHDIWLSRSNFCPLSIEIVEGRYVNCRPENLAAVIAQRARWEQLKIHLWAHSSLPTIEGPMPLLRHLDLVLKDHFSTANVIVCSEAPMLRSVILNDLAASKVILPWAQLTSLTLTTVYPRECAPLLKETPNLVHCELGLVLNDDDDMSSAEIQLPCLESLTLKYKYQSMTDYLHILRPCSPQPSGHGTFPWDQPHRSTHVIYFKIRLSAAGARHHGQNFSNQGPFRVPPCISLHFKVVIERLGFGRQKCLCL
ncbi:hypothetical protein B0H13DRAFT_319864 [Mycena leptocephala]|nr:hypothetical protein B0H13DRAFT_319864 [Mycena leptocephala]